MAARIVPLIMCGGAGTRLWPLSSEQCPKQFIKLFGRRSTFQETLQRIADPSLFDRPVIITAAAYRIVVHEQLIEIGMEADILLEPTRRDSGPAIATGAAFACRRWDRPVVLALAADHVVRDVDTFIAACGAARDLAAKGHIVTFGVQPDRAATEYGYISPGENIAGPVHSVSDFVEKPDAATATRYVDAGYLWNSGNFMFRADILLDEYRSVDAESVAAVIQALDRSVDIDGVISLDRSAFESAKPISIDYAVMERTTRAAVIPVSMGWSDIGSWRAVWELSPKDESGNVLDGPVVVDSVSNCYVSSDKTVIALEGVNDLVVVSTSDAVLISSQIDPNGLKRLVGKLKEAAPDVTIGDAAASPVLGDYQLARSDQYNVSRVVVSPGGRRLFEPAERWSKHWIVVRGIAHVTVGDERKAVEQGQSILIPSGAGHAVHNAGPGLLELIQVQL